MSCSSLCPRPYKGPVDTLGSKRDPIDSEKDWLIYAVRRLSREVVGRGRGQEPIWTKECKPLWWDDAKFGKWKNPTTNPKDEVEVLLKRYNALENHLHGEGKYPTELEKESALYKKGKLQELFQLIKEKDLRRSVEHICTKLEEQTSDFQPAVLKQISNRMSSAIETLRKREGKSIVLKEAEQSEHHDTNQQPDVTSPEIPRVKKRKLETTSASTKKRCAKKVKPQPHGNKVQKPNTKDSTSVSSSIVPYGKAVSDESNNKSARDSQNSNDSTIPEDQVEDISDGSSISDSSSDVRAGSDFGSQENQNLMVQFEKLLSDISAEELYELLDGSIIFENLLLLCDNKEDFPTENGLDVGGDGKN